MDLVLDQSSAIIMAATASLLIIPLSSLGHCDIVIVITQCRCFGSKPTIRSPLDILYLYLSNTISINPLNFLSFLFSFSSYLSLFYPYLSIYLILSFSSCLFSPPSLPFFLYLPILLYSLIPLPYRVHHSSPSISPFSPSLHSIHSLLSSLLVTQTKCNAHSQITLLAIHWFICTQLFPPSHL